MVGKHEVHDPLWRRWFRPGGEGWGGLVFLGALVMHLAWALADGYRVLTWFWTDDAFYYFAIARNVLEGRGVTFDGFGPTNGFQPLWLLVCLPVFALAPLGELVPFRVLIVVVGVLHGLTGWVLYRAARRFLLPWVALALGASWSMGLGPWKFVAVGAMESPLNALSLAVLWSVVLAMHAERAYTHPRRLRQLGWALAFAFLARLDNVFYAAGFGLWWLFHAAREAGLSLRASSWRAGLPRMARLLVPVLGPGLVLGGAYLAWNALYVGSLVPVSARVKHWWGTLGPTPYGVPFGGNFFWRGVKSLLDPRIKEGPWAYALLPLTRLYEGWVAPFLLQYPWFENMYRIRRLMVGYGPFLALAGGVLLATRRQWLPYLGRGVLWPWLLAALAHGLYYDYINHMGQRFWYWVGQMMFTHIFAALLVEAWFLSSRRWRAALRWDHWAWGVLAILVFAVPFYRRVWPRPSPYPPERHLYLDYARWVEAHTEPGSIVGATGAGSLGYFVKDRRVVGLDGLVGPAAYVRALEEGRMVEYWQEKGLDYVLINKGMRQSSVYRGLEPYLEGMDWYEHPIEGWRIKLWRFYPEGTP